MNKKYSFVIGAMATAALVSSCVSRGNNPGWEYAPDMYYSKGYEAYNQGDSNVINPYGMNMREPVAGTVAYGKLDYKYPFENNGEGYEKAGELLKMPEGVSLEDGRAAYMYGIYCSPCHGANGNNDGPVFKRVSTLKPAWKGYSDAAIQNLADGKIYHTLTYGKNNMGSHASVLTPADRWRLVKYVKFLGSQNGAVASVAQDSMSTAK